MELQQHSRFQVIRTLGEGGMGIVYEVFDASRQMHVALKTLRKLDSSSLLRFKREFRSIADLSHPSIVTLYELFSEGNNWFFTMELVHGIGFLDYVCRAASDDSAPSPTDSSLIRTVDASQTELSEDPPTLGTRVLHGFDEARLRDCALQLASGLVALHRAGMVHRDLKPSNILVREDGRVALMDFGIVGSSETEGESQLLGTPLYMAPEQAEAGPISPAADWYSFGTLLYRALTGRLPFAGGPRQILAAKQRSDPRPPRLVAREVPADLDSLCERLLRRNPAERLSGEEVMAVLGGGERMFELNADTTGARFVGREEELAQLHNAYETMRDGRPVAVFIVAESGMGKSTLVEQFLDEIASSVHRGPTILRGRCHERESVPYKALDGVVDSLARALMTFSEAKIASLVPEDIDPLARLFPVLREVPTLASAGSMIEVFAPQDLRLRAVAALRTLFSNLAADGPLVIAIDDIHWADEDSAELLVELFRERPQPACLLLALARAENLSSGDEPGALADQLAEFVPSRRIELGALSRSEQRKLVADLLGDEPSANLQREYEREAEGSPLLLAELARFVQENGVRGSADALPRLDEILLRRVGALPQASRELLEVITALGEPAPLWVAGNAAQLSAVEREHSASVLRNSRLVRVARHGEHPWVTAYHDKIREVLNASLSEQRSRELHRRIAETLESWEDATVDALARHWGSAGDREPAVRYLISAAHGAAEKLAFRRAANLYEAALQVGEHDADATRDLVVARARALSLAGLYAEAAAAYGAAARGVPADEAIKWTGLQAENLLRSGLIVPGMIAVRASMEHAGIRLPRSRMGAKLSMIWQRLRVILRGISYRRRSVESLDPRKLEQLDVMYASAACLGMTDNIRGADLQARHLRAALAIGEPMRATRALMIECFYRAAPGHNYERAAGWPRRVLQQALDLDDPFLVAMYHLAAGCAALTHAHVRAAAVECTRAAELLSH